LAKFYGIPCLHIIVNLHDINLTIQYQNILWPKTMICEIWAAIGFRLKLYLACGQYH